MLFLTLFFNWKLKKFEPIGDMIDSLDKQTTRSTKQAFSTFQRIGEAANYIVETIEDDDLLGEFVTRLVQKARKIGAMSLMGVKSVDSRKMIKAEKMVDEAMVKMATKTNPILTWVLETTGFDEELKKYPDLIPYLITAAEQKGLFDNADLLSKFAGFDLSSLSVPKPTGDSDQSESGF